MTDKKDTDETHDYRSNLDPAEEGAEIRPDASASEQEPAEEAEVTDEQEQENDVEQLRRRNAELEDRLLRTIAEFDNYRKRQARQFDEQMQSAGDRVLTDLLEVSDNLRRALETSGGDGNAEGLRRGTELIYDQLQGLLAKYDVTPIDSLGKPFNPNIHDALMQVESEEYPDGTVAMEMTLGYRRGDRILRHAKVAVSTGQNGSGDTKKNE